MSIHFVHRILHWHVGLLEEPDHLPPVQKSLVSLTKQCMKVNDSQPISDSLNRYMSLHDNAIAGTILLFDCYSKYKIQHDIPVTQGDASQSILLHHLDQNTVIFAPKRTPNTNLQKRLGASSVQTPACFTSTMGRAPNYRLSNTTTAAHILSKTMREGMKKVPPASLWERNGFGALAAGALTYTESDFQAIHDSSHDFPDLSPASPVRPSRNS